jgi:hypothetical protein
MRRMLFGTLVVLLLSPASAHGENAKLWVGASGSWGTYGMQDVNDAIGELNAEIVDTGLSMSGIHGGFGFGVEFGVQLPGRLGFGARAERQDASSKLETSAGSLELTLPANAYSAFATYSLSAAGKTVWQLGLGAGMIWVSGRQTSTDPVEGTQAIGYSGSGPVFDGFVRADGWFKSPWGWYADAGYRYATIGEFQEDGVTSVNPDGSKATLDYGGVRLRLGLRLELMR